MAGEPRQECLGYLRVSGLPRGTIGGNKLVYIPTGQPLDTLIEVYLTASNNAGDSAPSNTVQIKL